PTKEALIDGVAQYLAGRFIALHGHAPQPSGSAALDQLHQEFSDARFYRVHHPDLLVAIEELQRRATRDESIARIVNPLMGHWRDGIEAMLRAGIDEGVFHADLDPAAVALALIALLSGTAIHGISLAPLDGIFVEIERWLVARRPGAAAAKKFRKS